MTALPLYAYCSALYSSRRNAKARGERCDAADFRTIADFRKRHLAALAKPFLEAVLGSAEAGGEGRAGQARTCRARWRGNQGERLQAKQ